MCLIGWKILLLWDEIKRGEYEVYISQITMVEILGNKQPKLGTLLKYLEEINYSIIDISKEMEAYADTLIADGILTAKNRADCLHIASAVIHGCNLLLSWNFKHILRIKTVNGVRSVNACLGYKGIDIIPPSMVVERSSD
jgi:predicted nucleic acid-binding protein